MLLLHLKSFQQYHQNLASVSITFKTLLILRVPNFKSILRLITISGSSRIKAFLIESLNISITSSEDNFLVFANLKLLFQKIEIEKQQNSFHKLIKSTNK